MNELLTPESFADHAPSRPVLTMGSNSVRGLTLQRFRHPPGTLDVPGFCNELLVDHLAGPIFVEEADETGQRIRRWTGPGQVSVTPVGQPIHRIWKGRPDVVLLHLEPDLLHGVAAEIYGRQAGWVKLVPCLGVPDPVADQLIRLLLAEAEAPGPGASLMTTALTHALVIHLLRFHSTLASALPKPPASDPAPRMRRVIEQMRGGLGEELPLSQLSAEAGLSRSQFVRAFRAATGIPPHRYLRDMRILKARELLENTDLPIIEIALNCGFGQPGYFATAFRESTGLSPRAWRLTRRA